MAAAMEVGQRVSPILKQCFLLTRVLDSNKSFAYPQKNIEASSSRLTNLPSVVNNDFSNGKNLITTDHHHSPPCIFPQAPTILMQSERVHSVCKYDIKETYYNASSPDSDHKPSFSQLSLIFEQLQDELPSFFEGNFLIDLYEEKMKFINSLHPISFILRSRNAYAMYLRLQYLLARTFYYNNSFDLLKMTKDDESSEIQVRWMVQGTPRFIPWRLSQKVLLNGFSTFVINNRGKISLHKLDRVIPSRKEMYGISNFFVQIGLLVGRIRRRNPTPLHPQTDNFLFIKKS